MVKISYINTSVRYTSVRSSVVRTYIANMSVRCTMHMCLTQTLVFCNILCF
jgi:hypothetical protein